MVAMGASAAWSCAQPCSSSVRNSLHTSAAHASDARPPPSPPSSTHAAAAAAGSDCRCRTG
eukprot:3791263-Pleurochrysis_carterae.AAC.1